MFKYILALAVLAIPAAAFADTAPPSTPNPVYAELAATANDVLKVALEKATLAGDFLEEQVPLVVKELIAWKITSGLFDVVLGIVLLIPGWWAVRRLFRQIRLYAADLKENGRYDTKAEKPEESYWIPAIFSFVTTLFGIITAVQGMIQALQWWIAPRVALLEYATSLAR